uniref:Uncharacterized protein n=1 Tax=Branchiostoma floridae TaxID=7739 RepID=C3Y6Q7_BRAFL|eukprot:XP_002608007.1 hypothetical protein BRAFLDRAFT_74959 [Branchiostoma floridae]
MVTDELGPFRMPIVVVTKCRTVHPPKAPLSALTVQADPEGFAAELGHGQGEQEGVGPSISGHGEGAAVFTTGLGRIAEGLVADSAPQHVGTKTCCCKKDLQ